ncbi:MAG: antibiotic biosynthesis monooxygenase [Solirubrobacterales bacterium]|nr:antibiotic biosynthesis monooxygenase [Solirubrobacterales bacterium]
MTAVARHVRIRAKPGGGEALRRGLLEVADALGDAAGCELYVVNRMSHEPDVIWVTEQWQSQEALDAALASEAARERIPGLRELVADGGIERIDLEPVGGVGYPVGETGCAIVNLDEVEDMAPRFGLGDTGEARFARARLQAQGVGLSLQRVRPGVRSSFGHWHSRDEEIYVVLAGSGRIAVDDAVHEIKRLDAIRVAPASVRAFEAGPEGLEILATGTHHAGDAHMHPGFWPD